MDNFNQTNGSKNDFGGHKAAIIGLAVGLAVALAGDGYLVARSSKLSDEIASAQSNTQIQLS